MSITPHIWKLNWRQRGILLESVASLGLARMMILTRPFSKVREVVKRGSSEDRPEDKNLNTINDIGVMVRRAARRLPWNCECFVQALAAHWMLKRRSIPNKILIGVKKDEEGNLLSHAWLICGDQILTGAKGHESFKVITDFSEP